MTLLRQRRDDTRRQPKWLASYSHGPATLVDALHFWADQRPNDLAYAFIGEEESVSESVTYAELARKVLGISERLQQTEAPGARALLMYPPGLEFVAAFLACLHASVVAVPLYLPRSNRHNQRVRAVASDCEPTIILSHGSSADKLKAPDGPAASSGLHLLDTATVASSGAAIGSRASRHGLAFLQYTSGSTGTPKGVMVSNGNLLENIGDLCAGSATSDDSRFLSWLPLFHDMGLIAGVLQPLYWGVPSYLMAPAQFLREPLGWLRAISRFRATKSGAPNFAYSMCVRALEQGADLSKLDLSSWRIAWNGAEPIKPDVLEAFTSAFECVGFRGSAHFPCYGLAEATLYVSSGLSHQGVRMVSVDPFELERGRAIPAPDGTTAVRFVSCGPAQGSSIAIVDPQSGALRAEGCVGEIWVSGAGVALGYWNNEQETRRVFREQLGKRGDMQFLRTGDLGFLEGGELVVIGRIKDLIIVRGRNIHPYDIEHELEKTFTFLRPGSCAVVASPDDNEAVAVLLELDRATVRRLMSGVEGDSVANNLCSSAALVVSDAADVRVNTVALVKPGAFPRTSSGKVQRGRCAELIAQSNDALQCLWRSPLTKPPTSTWSGQEDGGDRQTLEQHVIDALAEWIKREFGSADQRIQGHTQLVELGIDSVGRMQVLADLQKRIQRSISEQIFENAETVQDVIERLVYVSPADCPNMADDSRHEEDPPHFSAWAGSLAEFRDVRGPALLSRIESFARWQRDRRSVGIWPYSRALHSAPGTSALVSTLDDYNPLSGVNFASQDYLSLSAHPRVLDAARDAIDRYGVHSAGSAALVGNTRDSLRLEGEIAEFLGFDSVTLYPTGWSAAFGVITALVRPWDHVVIDSLAHSSLVKGVESATRNITRHEHLSHDEVREALKRIRIRDRENSILVVTEGLFSMDADAPDLLALVTACREYNATLLVDVAHDLGATGPRGLGALGAQGVLSEVDLVMGSFSKTFASNGGFVASRSEVVAQYLRSFGSPHTFSNALSPVQVAVVREALAIVRQPEGEERRVRMLTAAETLRHELTAHGLQCYGSPAPMVPLHLGSESQARFASRALPAHGVHANLVEYPAVPVGAARFRFQVQADHTVDQVKNAARTIASVVASIPTRSHLENTASIER